MNTNERVQFLGSAEQLHKRRISEATTAFYRIYRYGNTLRFPYHNDNGQVVGFKIKSKKKEFHYEGQGSDQLFGQHLFPTSGKRIVITEGELDAASCYEVMSGWPMVSLPHGAASAKKDLQKQIPFLQGYQEIVLFFDNDEAGREATELASYGNGNGHFASSSLLPPCTRRTRPRTSTRQPRRRHLRLRWTQWT